LSKLIETRAEFQELAGVRLEEAKALLDVGKWGGAYYLAGYAIYTAIADGAHGVLSWIKTQW